MKKQDGGMEGLAGPAALLPFEIYLQVYDTISHTGRSRFTWIQNKVKYCTVPYCTHCTAHDGQFSYGTVQYHAVLDSELPTVNFEAWQLEMTRWHIDALAQGQEPAPDHNSVNQG